jgi:Kef-type K+ transport system membrane component KefB/nucleotide-binding universal stress UspA family protein
VTVFNNGKTCTSAARIVPAVRALSVAGIGPVADEAMSARRPAGVTGRVTARRYPSILIIGLVAVSAAFPALAAEGGARAASQALFIAELALLLVVGRLMGEAAQRIGQPSVMGQLIGGLLLGPSFFGLLWPSAQHAVFPPDAAQKSMIDAVSELGILMLLLLTGMETDLQLVRRVGRAAIAVALAGVAIPFACGFALGGLLPAEYLPNPGARLVTAIFLGTALSISSVKIVAVVVREMNFMRRDLGQIIVASAILEDTIGWVIIAMAFGLAAAGTFNVWTVGRAVVGTGLFLLASFTLGRRLVFRLIRWANDNFKSEFPVITTILVIMAVMALITQLIGVNTVLGAFVAGILIGQSPILTRHIDEQLRGLIVALFMPVFFGIAGLNADLTVLSSPALAALAVGLIAIASIGKFLGAFVGGTLGGMSRAESLALGCAMNARGSTEVIVASLGLSTGLLTQNLFTLIVTMAVVTTMVMPTMLRWSLKRLPLRKKERLRLEREELDAKGFVTNLERLLLVIDDSTNGRFGAQLAGIIAGSGGKPTTVLDLTGKTKAERKDEHKATREHAAKGREKTDGAATGDGEQAEDAVKSAAAAATLNESDRDQGRQDKVDVVTRTALDADAVAAEARKGYGLLVVGLANTRDRQDGFSKDLSLLAQSFDGPLAVVDSRGGRGDLPSQRYGRILIPVTGSDVSRRSVEIGLILARAKDAQVTALYVTRGISSTSRNSASRRQVTRRNELAVLRDIAALAERYDVALRSTTPTDMAPDQAILREAARGYDLLVLGVSRRPGDVLFFGNTAAAILERSPTSNLFVAS